MSEFDCPVCGESVKKGALSCPGCGACKDTGWGEDGSHVLPDDDFDYDSFVAKEFGGNPPKSAKDRVVAVVAIILILIWVLYIIS